MLVQGWQCCVAAWQYPGWVPEGATRAAKPHRASETNASAVSPHPKLCTALAVLAGKPWLGSIKLTLLRQHSLQCRSIAVQTHPEFLSLPVSLRTWH